MSFTTWSTEASERIEKLCKKRKASSFLHPVDAVLDGATHYELVVGQPMDFDTIQKKLQSNEYDTISQFIEDAELIFINAKMYNPPDHNIHIQAVACQKLFVSSFKTFIRKFADKDTKQRWNHMNKPGGFKYGLQFEENEKQTSTPNSH